MPIIYHSQLKQRHCNQSNHLILRLMLIAAYNTAWQYSMVNEQYYTDDDRLYR